MNYISSNKTSAHATACKNLRKQGFDAFLLLITKTTKKNGKFLDVKTPVWGIPSWAHQSICPVEERQWTRAYPALTQTASTVP